jgi:hypothetical protein
MTDGRRHNPSSDTEWTDEDGRVWHRRGSRGTSLDARRVRALVASHKVLIATWRDFEVELFEDAGAKRAALDRLLRDAAHPDDVRYTEWHSDSAQRMLLVEHFC